MTDIIKQAARFNRSDDVFKTDSTVRVRCKPSVFIYIPCESFTHKIIVWTEYALSTRTSQMTLQCKKNQLSFKRIKRGKLF